MLTHLGGSGNNNLICIIKLFQAKWTLHNGNSQSAASLNHMSLGNTAQNKLIIRMTDKHTVFEYLHIAVTTLCNKAIAMQYTLISSQKGSLLSTSHCRKQIQGFGIAMLEAGIRTNNQLQLLLWIPSLGLLNPYPELANHVLAIGMISRCYTASYLPIYKMSLTLYLLQEICQKLAQLLFLHRHLYIKVVGTGIEAIQMILQQINYMVATNSCIINTIAKEM